MSLPGVDIFISKFMSMYHDKSSKYFKNSLAVCILKVFFKDEWREKYSIINQHFQLLYTTVCNATEKFWICIRKYLWPRHTSNPNKISKMWLFSIPIIQWINYQGKIKSSHYQTLYHPWMWVLYFYPLIDGDKFSTVNQVSDKYG